MNKLVIIGNLTRDPEARMTQSGTPVCSFTVAVKKRKKDSTEAEFFNVSAWRELGENCAKYLRKGKKVAVMGTVTARAYAAQDGSLRAQMEVTADEIEFLSAKTEGE